MNWMQAYEIGACIVLFGSCLWFVMAMRHLPKVARVCTMLLGASALIRGAALIAKYAGLANLSKATIAAADGNIPLMTAVVLASIVWQQIRQRIGVDHCGDSSDAR